ncbi:MAG TPA: SPOR domain-containing protein [Bacteroidota bacterium]|nr:SPOR domain-containing protein [Bacteroidota bacterium]
MAFDANEPMGEEQERREEPQRQRPQPILHRPRATNPKIGMMAGGAVVLFFLILGGYFYMKNRSAGQNLNTPVAKVKTDTTAVKEILPADTSHQMIQQQNTPQETKKEKSGSMKTGKKTASMKSNESATAKKKSEMTESLPVEKSDMSTSGEYTIYIYSFRDKKNADDEAGRWKDAGYPSYVTQHKSLYRVSLGRYPSKDEARKDAEKLKEGFESGYYIDLMK